MKMYYECKQKVHLPSLKTTLAKGDVISVEDGKITLDSGLSFDVEDDFNVMMNAGFFNATECKPVKKNPVVENTPEPTFHVVDEDVKTVTKFAESKKDFEEKKQQESKAPNSAMNVVEVDSSPIEIKMEGMAKTASVKTNSAVESRNSIKKENQRSKEDVKKDAELKKKAREESVKRMMEADKSNKKNK